MTDDKYTAKAREVIARVNAFWRDDGNSIEDVKDFELTLWTAALRDMAPKEETYLTDEQIKSMAMTVLRINTVGTELMISFNDMYQVGGFLSGFKAAMKMNAIEQLKKLWPSEEEFLKSEEFYPDTSDGDWGIGFNDGLYKAYSALRRTVLGEK